MSAGSALLDARRILAALDLEPGMHIADLCAGRTGHFTFPAGEMVGDSGRVYAVDILPSVIAILKSTRALRSATNVHPVWGDIERAQGIPLADASLDVALLIHTLSALQDWEALVREARRLMKPEGRMVVVDWHGDTAHPAASQLTRSATAQESDMLFRGLGCRKCGEFTPSRWHWGRVYAS